MKVHKMSYLDCMDLDINDYLDYLEFDMIRSPIEQNNPNEIIE